MNEAFGRAPPSDEPGEGFGLGGVVLGDEAVDGGLEVDDRAEGSVLEAAPGELGEEALDGVQP